MFIFSMLKVHKYTRADTHIIILISNSKSKPSLQGKKQRKTNVWKHINFWDKNFNQIKDS